MRQPTPLRYRKPAGPVNHHQLDVTLRIGKEGITENVIKQALALLKKHKVIKARFLTSAIADNKKALAEKLAADTNSKIVHRVGFVVVLARKV